MARPTKSAKVLSDCSQTNEEIEERIDKENILKGKANKLDPPEYLNKNQSRIFNFIKSELEESGILGNLDIYILTTGAIAIDRVQYFEDMINKKPSLLLNSNFMSSKDKYTKDLYRCCNELSLSPQSRAKIANMNMQAKENNDDDVIKALKGEL